MTAPHLIELVAYAEPVLCLCILLAMARRRLLSVLKPVTALLATRLAVSFILDAALGLALSRRAGHLLASKIYFRVYWLSYAVEAVLTLWIVYRLYHLTLERVPGSEPKPPLDFRWASAISGAVALGLAFAPHAAINSLLIRVIARLEESFAVVTLCLLLFVYLSMRNQGISHRSRIFGITLGLAVMRGNDLVTSAWIGTAFKLSSPLAVTFQLVTLLGLGLWLATFLASTNPAFERASAAPQQEVVADRRLRPEANNHRRSLLELLGPL